jgi:hypothetical protein
MSIPRVATWQDLHDDETGTGTQRPWLCRERTHDNPSPQEIAAEQTIMKAFAPLKPY